MDDSYIGTSDIQQGVAIGIFSRFPRNQSVSYSELWGQREKKYSRLKGDSTALKWVRLAPAGPHYFFVPKALSGLDEYMEFFSLRKAMPVGTSAVQTKRDALFIDFDREPLVSRMRELLQAGPTKEMLNKYPLQPSGGWHPDRLRGVKFRDECIREYLYRPFDFRFVYYDDALLGRSRVAVFCHMLHPNVAMATLRQTVDDAFRHVFCTRAICDINLTIGHHVSDQVFPLYVYENSSLDGRLRCRPNFSPDFLKALSNRLQIPCTAPHSLPDGLSPEDIFNSSYAILHSSTYRTRYAELLKIDFPRLPLASSLAFFQSLARLGSELVSLHLLESPKLEKHLTRFVGGRGSEVEKVSWSDDKVWINKAKTTGFVGVPEAVWNFHIGGYQVCEKWLKDRKGRNLSKEDIEHYHRIVVALSETIRLMKEFDEVIEQHGGWLGAFQVVSIAERSDAPQVLQVAEPKTRYGD